MELRDTEGELSDSEVPGALIDRGWRQGTIFSAPGAQSSCVYQDATGLVTRARETPSDGRFIVVSQSCDINASIAKEPVVEAFACSVEPDAVVRASYSKSFRWFEVDPEEGLIAYAMHRIPFDKRALLGLPPHPWPSGPDRLHAFARWLGGRAARPAIPGPVDQAFVKPLRDVLDAMRKKQPTAFVAFHSAVAEILIGLPESELPPFDIPLRLLLAGETLSAEEADAISLVETRLRAKLNPAKAQLREFIPTLRSRMSVETYQATALVELEYVTHQGEEIIAAQVP
jgi:hypothetical protein